MSLQYTIVDAFTSTPFAGNPACVIQLDTPSSLSPTQMQQLAREFNLPETAFLVPQDTPSERDEMSNVPTVPEDRVRRFGLRWFTPEMEFPICGHATLAAAHALFGSPALVDAGVCSLRFDTMSGKLSATLLSASDNVPGEGEGEPEIEISLPSGSLHTPPEEVVQRAKRAITSAVGRDVDFVYFGAGEGVSYGAYLVVEVAGPELEGLDVNPGPLADLEDTYTTVVLTTPSPSPSYAFVSRVFAPSEGIPEDPVTGSAHCLLAPYWSDKLGIPPGQELKARQVSVRGGEMGVVWDEKGGRCRLRGKAVTVMRGEVMTLPLA